jgi:hypothetical protein
VLRPVSHPGETIIPLPAAFHDSVGSTFLGFLGTGAECLLVLHQGNHHEAAAIVDGTTMTERFAFPRPERLIMQLSPDGHTIAVGDRSGNVSILSAKTGEMLVRCSGRKGDVLSVAFSPNGNSLAASDDGERVRIWDAPTAKTITHFSAGDPLRRWSPAIAMKLAVSFAIW